MVFFCEYRFNKKKRQKLLDEIDLIKSYVRTLVGQKASNTIIRYYLKKLIKLEEERNQTETKLEEMYERVSNQ